MKTVCEIQIVFCSAIVALIILPLMACNIPYQAQGTMAWIDQPLDSAQLPLAPIKIQAHAADSDGIARMEFLVSDILIASVTTGGMRLEEAGIEWIPPEAGNYTINVRAIDTQGNTNARTPASVQITVGGGAPTPAVLPPASGQCPAETLVAPLLLSPADGATVTGEPLLSWSYPDTSCHPYSYAVDISDDALFTDNSQGFGTLDHNETNRQWPLPAGQCYYWRVHAYVPDVEGPFSPAWKFCITVSTAVTSSSPIFTLLQNANCRQGPGTAYDSVGALMQGDSAAIEGRNADNSWFWVKKPSGSGHCWISASTGTASGYWQAVRVVAAPLPSTIAATPMLPATNTPTFSGTDIPTPADFTPPTISNVSINPTIVAKAGCGTPDTLTISAIVTDASDVANVIYEVTGPTPMDAGDGYLLPMGGDFYQATIGPIAGNTGAWTIKIYATDMPQNAAELGPWTFQVICLE